MNVDILWRKWGNIVKRLEALSREHRSGYKAVSIVIMIDPAGNPVFWSEPDETRFEPKSCRISDIILAMTNIPQIYITDDDELVDE
jgi:hypothetical protein